MYYCGQSHLPKNNVSERYLTLMNVIIHLFFSFFFFNVIKGSVTFNNVHNRLKTLFLQIFIFGKFSSLDQIKAKSNFLTINLDFWTNFECNKHKLRHKIQIKNFFIFGLFPSLWPFPFFSKKLKKENFFKYFKFMSILSFRFKILSKTQIFNQKFTFRYNSTLKPQNLPKFCRMSKFLVSLNFCQLQNIVYSYFICN